MATPNFINPQIIQQPNWVNGEWELVNGDPVFGMEQLPTANFPSGDRVMATPNFINPQLFQLPMGAKGMPSGIVRVAFQQSNM